MFGLPINDTGSYLTYSTTKYTNGQQCIGSMLSATYTENDYILLIFHQNLNNTIFFTVAKDAV